MKVFADINVSVAIVAGLRALGHDVTRVDGFLPATATDAEISSLARAHQAAVLTRDQDFAALLAMTGGTAPSIVNLRHSRTDSEFLVRLLDEVLRAHDADLVAGAVVSIDDGGVRVHELPIGTQR